MVAAASYNATELLMTPRVFRPSLSTNSHLKRWQIGALATLAPVRVFHSCDTHLRGGRASVFISTSDFCFLKPSTTRCGRIGSACRCHLRVLRVRSKPLPLVFRSIISSLIRLSLDLVNSSEPWKASISVSDRGARSLYVSN